MDCLLEVREFKETGQPLLIKIKKVKELNKIPKL